METCGQITSFIAALCIAYSIFSKNKKKMITWQLCSTIFCILTAFFLKGYSSIVANFLMSARHTIEIKGKLTGKITLIICILLIGLGLYFNSNGTFGLLPITASTLFAVFSYIIKDVQKMRLVIALTHMQWLFFDFHIKSYSLFVLDIIIIITSLCTYYKVWKDEKNGG